MSTRISFAGRHRRRLLGRTAIALVLGAALTGAETIVAPRAIGQGGTGKPAAPAAAPSTPAATTTTPAAAATTASRPAPSVADACEEDDVGMLILQGLSGQASATAAADNAARIRRQNLVTDNCILGVEQKFAALQSRIANVLAGIATVDDKFDPNDPVKFGVLRGVNEYLQAFQNAITAFQSNFLSVQGAAVGLDALVAQDELQRQKLGDVDDYIGYVQVAGAVTKAGQKAYIKVKIKGLQGAADDATTVVAGVDAQAGRAGTAGDAATVGPSRPGAGASGGGAQGAAGPRPPGGSQDAVGTRPPGTPPDAVATRPPGDAGGAAPGGQPRPPGFATQNVNPPGAAPPLPPGAAATIAPGGSKGLLKWQRTFPGPPPKIDPTELIDPGKNVQVLFQGNAAVIFTDGAKLLDEVVDKGVMAAARNAGMGDDVPGLVLELILEMERANEVVLKSSLINERILGEVLKRMGLIPGGLPGDIPAAASTLLQNLYTAIGRGAKGNLAPQLEQLVTAIKGNFSSFDEFLSNAARAFDQADDGYIGFIQTFSETDLRLLRAAYEAGGDVARIESLLGATQTAALRGVTADQLAREELLAFIARTNEKIQAFKEDLALSKDTSPQALGKMGGGVAATLAGKLLGDTPATAGVTAAAAEAEARQALQNSVLFATPYIQQAGGIEYVLERFDAIRRYKNHSFMRFIRDSAVHFLTSPFQSYSDLLMGAQAIGEWEKLILGKSEQIAGMQKAFGDALQALRSLVQTIEQAGIGKFNTFIGDEV
ncbi:MAG: hypothetical protein K2Z80_36910 [Xanthobacteraceae bacterium]|nr:hypothetical protein [Xanthobacteraceae bacterium]